MIASALLLLGSLLARSSEAATYYVNPASGSDAANGSAATPWKTIARIKSATQSPMVGPGDTVNIVPGTYTRTQYQLGGSYPVWTQNDRLGLAGQPITIQADPSGSVTFDAQNSPIFINFVPTAGTVPNTAYYVVIKNLNFKFFQGSVLSFGKATTLGVAVGSHVAVVGCSFDTTYNAGTATLGSENFHHIIYTDNNNFRNGDLTFGYNPAHGNDHGYYLAEGSSFIVVDRAYSETIAGMVFHAFGHYINSAPASVSNLIYRRSISVNANHSVAIVSGGLFDKVYWYNNTAYTDANSYPAVAAVSGINSTQAVLSVHGGNYQQTNFRWKNNIGYGYVEGGGQLWSDASNTFPGWEVDYNLFAVLGGNLYRWLGTGYSTLPAFQAASGFGAHDINANPQFTSIPGRNFSLALGSPAINAGTTLTTAVGAGTTSATLTVGDAGYFHDGYGLLTGDTIRVGAATTTITSINYSTNVLTVSPAISWSNGAAVSLPYNGSAPDMGAVERAEVATQLTFSTPPITSYPGIPMATVAVQGLTAGGVLDPTFTGTITLTLTVVSGSGTLTGTLSKAAVGGQATFGDLVVSATGTYRLHAVASGLSAADSANFAVIPASLIKVGGVDLDGVDDYLNAGTSSAYQCANQTCTVMGWFRSNTNSGYILAKRSIGGDVGGYFLRVDSGGNLTGRTYDNGGSPVIQRVTSSTTAGDGQWHCFAMVFTTVTSGAAGNDLTLYYDGVLDSVSGGSGSGVGYDNTNNPLVFGALSDFDTSGWMYGGVEDIRFYTSGLSAENIARYCSAQVKFGGYTFGTLLSYWPLNQCAEGSTGDAVAFADVNKGGSAATGVDGANNTGIGCHGSNRMTYPASVQ